MRVAEKCGGMHAWEVGVRYRLKSQPFFESFLRSEDKKLGSDTVLKVKPHFEIFLAFKGMFNKARASAALCELLCSRPSGVQRHPLRLI